VRWTGILIVGLLSACGTTVTAPGTFGIPIGPFRIEARLSSLALQTKLLTVLPNEPPAAFSVRSNVVYADLPPPSGIGLSITYHRNF